MKSERSLIERFHGVLIESIREDAPSYLAHSFTVAEIYQALVPYGTHRDRLGIEMNGDYEDALLRLLSGEGEYLILESEPARNRLRRELERKNPNTGIYREFAAVEVRLNPDKIPDTVEVAAILREEQTSLGGFDPEPSTNREGSAGSARTADSDGGGSEASKLPKSGSTSGTISVGATSAAEKVPKTGAPSGAPARCPECEGVLPERTSLRFCPSCGANVLEMPCRECGEMLERVWDFCVACGTRT